MAEAGKEYDDFVECNTCRGRRPRSACDWTDLGGDEEGFYECKDLQVCIALDRARIDAEKAWRRKQRLARKGKS